MKPLLRRAALGLSGIVAPHVPLTIYRALLPRAPYGFFYHAVSDHPLPHVRHLYPHKSTQAFEQDLAWLNKHSSPVGYADLEAHFSAGKRLPSNASFISFDDGFRECYDVVRPLLLKHHVPCIFFLTTDWIDNRALFFRSKISLALDALDRLSPEEQAGARKAFGARFGAPTDPLAFTLWLKDHKEADARAVDAICETLGIHSDHFLKENQPYLTRTQVRTMQAEGFTFGAHSCNHTKFMHLAPEEQAGQIVRSCRIVAEITGADSVPFAFPFSGERVSRSMLRKLRKDHPEIGLIFDTKKLQREPGIVHRTWVDQPTSSVPPDQNLAFWLRDAYVRLATRNESQLS